MARKAPSFLAWLCLSASVLLGASLGPAPASAESDDLLELAALLPEPDRVHPDITAQAPVDLRGVGVIAERLSSARADLNDAQSRAVRSLANIGSLEIELDLLLIELRDWRSEAGTAQALLEAAEADLAEFAVDTFTSFEDLDLGALRLEGSVDPAETLSGHVGGVLADARDRTSERHQTATGEVAALASEEDDIEAELVDLEAALTRAEADAAAAQALVEEYEPAFELALLGAPVEGLGFPVVVLDAYYRAQLLLAEERPSCQVRWDQLAGIGRVESVHGTYGGQSVGSDGRTSGEILGPVLDGDPWQAIADTDGGRYDGDTEWDRAIGPMQFIPGSWGIYGRDGNGDGEEDPHNIYDAAVAAGQHLCGTTGGLAAEAQFQRALLGYNRSGPYGLTVMAYSGRYRDAVTLAPAPV